MTDMSDDWPELPDFLKREKTAPAPPAKAPKDTRWDGKSEAPMVRLDRTVRGRRIVRDYVFVENRTRVMRKSVEGKTTSTTVHEMVVFDITKLAMVAIPADLYPGMRPTPIGGRPPADVEARIVAQAVAKRRSLEHPDIERVLAVLKACPRQ